VHRLRPFRSSLVPHVAAAAVALAPFALASHVAAGESSGVATIAAAPHAAARTLEEYRRFRALSIDLLGRMPTRDEIAELEREGFDLDRWIDARLGERGVVDRLLRVYMDALRLEVSPAFTVTPQATTLRRVQIKGSGGAAILVYYRLNQRRAREATDGEFCLTKGESGLQVPAADRVPTGEPIAVTQKVLDANTVEVKPWWLYGDYRAADPVLRFGDTWKTASARFQPLPAIVNGADGKPLASVRVCREEAQTAATGKLLLTGRKRAPGPPPFDRLRPLPLDDGYAVQHKSEPVSCASQVAHTLSSDCGCGLGLERCLPSDANAADGRAFALPDATPLGLDRPLSAGAQTLSAWRRFWWTQEAVRFLEDVLANDRDFRDVVTARRTFVNGPLAQFYRAPTSSTPPQSRRAFGLVDEGEPLFDPARLPADLLVNDVDRWERVDDRGPRAAGVLTMPVFLTKYASRRARGAAVYQAFLCKTFLAAGVELTPSDEPDLTKRPGCSTCHATLEPLAAYFARVPETDWSFLPPASFPVESPLCKKNAQGKAAGFCAPFYDPAFSDDAHGTLRGAYASRAHVDAGPAGAGAELAASPEFASCAVERVSSAFLGRPLTADDAALAASLRDVFVSSGYRMRALVRALVKSPRYLDASPWSSTLLRSARAAGSTGGAR
jgi:hypothetical protein